MLKLLDLNKTVGLNDIGPKLLQTMWWSSSTFLINQSSFPDSFKEACLIPMITKNNKRNYIPISMLPTILKVIKRQIASQIHYFFYETNIIHEHRCFLETISC